jgi:hypothetical protein
MKKSLDCVYLKQHLNCVLFCEEDRDDTENKTDNDYEESGMEASLLSWWFVKVCLDQ